MSDVEVVHWNPRRRILPGKLGRLIPIKRPVDNFGDLIGPLVVQRMRERLGLTEESASGDPVRLLSVGSILHFAHDGDTVWGSGVNGKIAASEYAFSQLDVRAVRGPRTRAFLAERGISAPEVYGDPALLLPLLLPQLREWAGEKKHRVTIVPNLHDVPHYAPSPDLLRPTSPLMECLERIARSEHVVGSSLHGIIVAESLGIPATLVAARAEATTKYDDYFHGTGRETRVLPTVEAALADAGTPGIVWQAEPLLEAFPADLWRRA